VPLLEKAKHEAIAVDLPGDDEHAGLSAYADRVVEAIGTHHAVLVVQSLGDFTAPLAFSCSREQNLCSESRCGERRALHPYSTMKRPVHHSGTTPPVVRSYGSR
jgi:hypothetical protein